MPDSAEPVREAARSSAVRRRLGRAAAVLLAGCSLASCGGSSTSSHPTPAGPPLGRAGYAGGYGWLRPAAAPRGWHSATIASGEATLFYPPRWKPLRGDVGTVTAALRDSWGTYIGYLNVTPRQGLEQLHGWADFRTSRNRGDGDRSVRQTAAAEGLRFARARGSCVTDDYLSRVGANRYREIACIVAGERATSVFVGAALLRDWPRIAPALRRAASAFRER